MLPAETLAQAPRGVIGRLQRDAFRLDSHLPGCCLLDALRPSHTHAGVSHGRTFSDYCTCCHTETEVADPTFYLTLLRYPDTGPTSASTDCLKPDSGQGRQWSTLKKKLSHSYDSAREKNINGESGNGSQGPVSWRPTSVKWRQSSVHPSFHHWHSTNRVS